MDKKIINVGLPNTIPEKYMVNYLLRHRFYSLI